MNVTRAPAAAASPAVRGRSPATPRGSRPRCHGEHHAEDQVDGVHRLGGLGDVVTTLDPRGAESEIHEHAQVGDDERRVPDHAEVRGVSSRASTAIVAQDEDLSRGERTSFHTAARATVSPRDSEDSTVGVAVMAPPRASPCRGRRPRAVPPTAAPGRSPVRSQGSRAKSRWRKNEVTRYPARPAATAYPMPSPRPSLMLRKWRRPMRMAAATAPPMPTRSITPAMPISAANWSTRLWAHARSGPQIDPQVPHRRRVVLGERAVPHAGEGIGGEHPNGRGEFGGPGSHRRIDAGLDAADIADAEAVQVLTRSGDTSARAATASPPSILIRRGLRRSMIRPTMARPRRPPREKRSDDRRRHRRGAAHGQQAHPAVRLVANAIDGEGEEHHQPLGEEVGIADGTGDADVVGGADDVLHRPLGEPEEVRGELTQCELDDGDGADRTTGEHECPGEPAQRCGASEQQSGEHQATEPSSAIPRAGWSGRRGVGYRQQGSWRRWRGMPPPPVRPIPAPRAGGYTRATRHQEADGDQGKEGEAEEGGGTVELGGGLQGGAAPWKTAAAANPACGERTMATAPAMAMAPAARNSTGSTSAAAAAMAAAPTVPRDRGGSPRAAHGRRRRSSHPLDPIVVTQRGHVPAIGVDPRRDRAPPSVARGGGPHQGEGSAGGRVRPRRRGRATRRQTPPRRYHRGHGGIKG